MINWPSVVIGVAAAAVPLIAALWIKRKRR